MLSYIDPILFPDELRIFEVATDTYVYEIFKNGSRSLENSKFRLLSKDEIHSISQVDVYVREPFDRFVVGVQSFLEHNPKLEKNTAVQMIDDLLFLNSHFSLQFHWIANLVRHVNIPMSIKPLSDLYKITNVAHNSISRDQLLVNTFKSNQKLQFYLKLDKILTEVFVGKTVMFTDIVQYIKTNEPELYREVIQRSKDICSVLD